MLHNMKTRSACLQMSMGGGGVGGDDQWGIINASVMMESSAD